MRILICYANQISSKYSEWFDVIIGVRQEGILSLLLFNVYVDVKSIQLDKNSIGWMLNRLLDY